MIKANGGAGCEESDSDIHDEMMNFSWVCTCTVCGVDVHGNGWRAHGVCSKECFRGKTGMFFRERTQDDIDREFNGEGFYEDHCKVCGAPTDGSGWEDIGLCCNWHIYLWNGTYNRHPVKECNEPTCEDEFDAEISCIICGKDATQSGWHMIGCCSKECAGYHMDEFPQRYNSWFRDIDEDESDDDRQTVLASGSYVVRRKPRKLREMKCIKQTHEKTTKESKCAAAILAVIEQDDEEEELAYRYAEERDSDASDFELGLEWGDNGDQYWEYFYKRYPNLDSDSD